MAGVSFQHVFKYYGNEEKASVDDFHLDIEDGEFLVLVGPSGCGKSTTLRMLAGLEDISEGEIYIGDKLVNYVSPKNRDIAMVFQNYALYPNLSVYENMALGLKLRKTAKYEIELKVNRAAKILEITHLLNRLPSQLSGGQKQRVALGRAIVREPQVFLMDEPLSNLDAKLRTQTRAEIVKMHAAMKTTTVYVTHDQVEAMTMGTRIVVMKDGEIQQVAKPQELYDQPANQFVAGFVGTPPMNFMNGKVTVSDGEYFFENRRLKLPLPAAFHDILREGGYNRNQITMGIRAEHLFIHSPNSAEPSGLIGQVEQVKVDMIELLGSDTYVHLQMDPAVFIVRVEAHTPIAAGDVVSLGFRMDRVHLFDGDSGRNLSRRIGPQEKVKHG